MTHFNQSLNNSLRNKLDSIKTTQQLTQIEISSIKKPITIEFYQKWLALGYHGTMKYLSEHFQYKSDPTKLFPNLKSVISIAQSYFPAEAPSKTKMPARTALYSQNDDYHHWLKEKLNLIIKELQVYYPNELFFPYVDSGPILERDMAYQNQLGWFGKNTCIIHPAHGSLFFIAEIFTSLDLSAETENLAPLPDFCGTCQKCIEICPTQAIVSPRVLKADQCISYLTIEAKTAPPVELRKKIGDWFFGCDLCQTVCPWNEKVFRKNEIPKTDKNSTELKLKLSAETRQELVAYFTFLLTSSNKKIQKHHIGSPLLRAGAKGLKRNALIVIANQNITELKKLVLDMKEPELQELAHWAAEQLS